MQKSLIKSFVESLVADKKTSVALVEGFQAILEAEEAVAGVDIKSQLRDAMFAYVKQAYGLDQPRGWGPSQDPSDNTVMTVDIYDEYTVFVLLEEKNGLNYIAFDQVGGKDGTLTPFKFNASQVSAAAKKIVQLLTRVKQENNKFHGLSAGNGGWGPVTETQQAV
jgi:hypothetical protein